MPENPVPAEWSGHKAMWVGFPSHAELWREDLPAAQREVAALARALALKGGEHVRLLVGDPSAMGAAETLVGDVREIEIVSGRFGDIWLRDTGPIFGRGRADAFKFNGWGGKYVLDGDDGVAALMARHAGTRLQTHDFVLEGGALDHDGAGTVLTTRQCLLNPNRNPGWTEAAAEAALQSALGARKVLWLDEGLLNDHTDGHVDNLARFLAPGVVACPIALGDNDPNAGVYADNARALASMADAEGRPLEVVRIPSPGRLGGPDGQVVPASHMNFVIANRAVIMPDYGATSTPLALAALEAYFPDREVIALPSTAILTGGGSFHCITQQEPA